MSTDLEDRPTNVKKVTLPEVNRQDSLFDLKRDISEEGRETINSLLDELFQKFKNKDSLDRKDLQFLSAVAIILPDETSRMVDDEVWNAMQNFLAIGVEGMNGSVIVNKLNAAAAMKLASPRRAQGIQFLTEEEWSYIKRLHPINMEQMKLNNIISAVILAPERRNEFEIPIATWNLIKGAISGRIRGGQFDILAELIGKIKMIDSEKMPELEIDEVVWSQIWEEEMAALKKWTFPIDPNVMEEGYAFQLLKMSLFAATQVRITNRGVILEFDELQPDLKKDISVPQTKKY